MYTLIKKTHTHPKLTKDFATYISLLIIFHLFNFIHSGRNIVLFNFVNLMSYKMNFCKRWEKGRKRERREGEEGNEKQTKKREGKTSIGRQTGITLQSVISE